MLLTSAAAAALNAVARCPHALLLPAGPLLLWRAAAAAAPSTHQHTSCSSRLCSTSGGSGDGDGSSAAAQPTGGGAHMGDTAVADFQRRVAALQQDAQAPSDVATWLSGISSSASGSSRRGPQAAAGDWSSSSSSSSRGSSSSSSSDGQAVSAQHGYAALGGVDPEASQQVAGAQQPKLHPTRNFGVGDTYDPADLSPLAQEEEEPWVPQMRRRVSQQRVAAAEVKAQLDYKNVDLLLGYVSASGRIKSRRQTRLPPSVHNRVARTVKFARHMALLPYEMRVGHDADAGRWKRQRSMAAAAAADKAERS